MNYFEQKAREIKDKICTEIQEQPFILETDSRIIEIGLKEVARDIRHQIIDEIYNTLESKMYYTEVENLIMNFEPKYTGDKSEN